MSEIVGVDFTSRPTPAKPVTAAWGRLEGDRLRIREVLRLPTLDAFEAMLGTPGPWVGAFDFPFGLPRELIDALGWPGAGMRQRRFWPRLIRHYAALDRDQVTKRFDRFRARRPEGRKYAHRATEIAAGAHASMKLVNPPVAWMLHEGAPILLRSGVHVPGIRSADRNRVALEAYPGHLLRGIAAGWGARRTPPYKNDATGKQTAEHKEIRIRLLWALVEGEHPLTIRLDLPVGIAADAADDGTGDTLDALAAAVQAAWGAAQGAPAYGLPRRFDPLEGWIVGALPSVPCGPARGAPGP
jgi:hypothetical protein